ncbi:MAG: hypothetical protein EOO09_16920 [Chitinophagaceae bacterium]|nr:MAG: hypothetical protein EOO09_16920 [Chitinophagaceae bacterium]
MKKSFFKLVLFAMMVSVPLLLLHTLTHRLRSGSSAFYFDIPVPSGDDTAWYFIGSSRVQLSVDTAVIQRETGKTNVHNVGLSGSTFMTNCFVAMEMMKSDQPKVLFIELSAMLADMPVDKFRRSDSLDAAMYRTAKLFYRDRGLQDNLLLRAEFFNRAISERLFYYDQLRTAFSAGNPGMRLNYGYVATPGPGIESDKSILRWAEFDEFHNPPAVREYNSYFNRLYKAAAASNTRIVFFMPLTFGSDMERNLVIPVYNSLPETARISVTRALVDSLGDRKYLASANHFNAAGAAIYSRWLGNELVRMRKGGLLSIIDQ